MISSADQAAWANFPSAVIFVEVIKPDGTIGSGTAFHLGKGYFATARHVVAARKIKSVGRDDTSLKTTLGGDGKPHRTTTYGAFQYTGPFEVFDHPDDSVDVAIIQLTGQIKGYQAASNLQPYVRLASDADVLSPGELLMTAVLVAGFPPISQTNEPHLVVVRGEISAVIKNRNDQKRHFVLSGMARGGFSGGPVFLVGNPTVRGGSGRNAGAIIGVIGASLGVAATSDDPRPEELGFMAAVSIETVRETIKAHSLPLASA